MGQSIPNLHEDEKGAPHKTPPLVPVKQGEDNVKYNFKVEKRKPKAVAQTAEFLAGDPE
jgi:hypothetical protein